VGGADVTLDQLKRDALASCVLGILGQPVALSQQTTHTSVDPLSNIYILHDLSVVQNVCTMLACTKPPQICTQICACTRTHKHTNTHIERERESHTKRETERQRG